MVDPEPADTSLTRVEFYRALMPVWFFLAALTAGPLLRPLAPWVEYLPPGIALLAGLLCASAAGNARAGGSDRLIDPPPPSDTVRAIARDPARKIEAIKFYRDETGTGLAVAKRVVERLIVEQRTSAPG